MGGDVRSYPLSPIYDGLGKKESIIYSFSPSRMGGSVVLEHSVQFVRCRIEDSLEQVTHVVFDNHSHDKIPP